MKTLSVLVVTSFCFFGCSLGASDCYRCDSDDSACDDPIGKKFHVEDCEDVPTDDGDTFGSILKGQIVKQNPQLSRSEMVYSCLTLVVLVNKNESIYRTCLLNTTDVCDLVKTELREQNLGVVKKCLSCDQSVCNNQTLDQLSDSSTNHKISLVVFVLFLATLLK